MTTPSYYPPGWDAERWQTAEPEEFATLSREDLDKFHTGIRAHLSEEELEKFFNERDRRRREIKAATGRLTPPPVSDEPPNFIKTLKQLQHEDPEYPEWGFVVFRTAGYGSDGEAVVRDVKESIDAYMDRQFNITHVTLTPDRLAEVQRAKEKFRLMWIEDKELDGASPEEVAR